MKKLKLVVVGPGLIGSKHIELICKHSLCELAAIVAPNTDENIGIAKKLNVSLYYDLPSMFDKVEVDGVIVSSPNIFHVQQATQCICGRMETAVTQVQTQQTSFKMTAYNSSAPLWTRSTAAAYLATT
jgi:acyl-CoA synthetase (NDP forming)